MWTGRRNEFKPLMVIVPEAGAASRRALMCQNVRLVFHRSGTDDTRRDLMPFPYQRFGTLTAQVYQRIDCADGQNGYQTVR